MKSWLNAAAVYTNPRICSVFFLGFSSGLPLALTGQTLSLWLKDEGLSLTAIGVFAVVSTPYALKFAWAPIMDTVRIPLLSKLLGRRRSWILICQFILILATAALGLSDPAGQIGLTAMLALTVAFSSASQDVVIDAYRVEILEEYQLAAGAAVVVFGYRIGMLVSGAGALYLASIVSWPTVYLTMALFTFVGVVTVLLNPEPNVCKLYPSVSHKRGLSDHSISQRPWSCFLKSSTNWLHTAIICPFSDFLVRPKWVVILLFVVFYKFGDSLAGVMTFPFLDDLGFTKITIANVAKIFGFAATLVGLAAGGILMAAIGLYKSLWICGFLQMASNLMFAIQAEAGADATLLAVTIGLENFSGGMGTAVFVAYLSSLCSIAYTATQYALLSSLMVIARTWLAASSGFLAEYLGWTVFFLGTVGAALPGLVFLWWLGHSGFEKHLSTRFKR